MLSVQQIQPGHAIYESIKKQVLAEEAAREEAEQEEVYESIDRFIDDMHQRRLANQAIVEKYGRPTDGAEAEEDADDAGTAAAEA